MTMIKITELNAENKAEIQEIAKKQNKDKGNPSKELAVKINDVFLQALKEKNLIVLERVQPLLSPDFLDRKDLKDMSSVENLKTILRASGVKIVN
jgi:hypothetical protein